MFWVDTCDGGMVNLDRASLIRIFGDDGIWLDEDEEIDEDKETDDVFYKVFCQLPFPPYVDNNEEHRQHSHLLFRGKHSECKRFMDWLKDSFGNKFMNIPNDIFELKSSKTWDSSNIPWRHKSIRVIKSNAIDEIAVYHCMFQSILSKLNFS